MNYHAGFILKVLLLSGGLSVVIKYGGSLLTIPASEALVPIVVLMPSFILAIALGWRASYSNRQID
jgi:hypothetical protein